MVPVLTGDDGNVLSRPPGDKLKDVEDNDVLGRLRAAAIVSCVPIGLTTQTELSESGMAGSPLVAVYAY